MYALKAADVQTELQTLEMLSALTESNSPLPPVIPFLITGPDANKNLPSGQHSIRVNLAMAKQGASDSLGPVPLLRSRSHTSFQTQTVGVKRPHGAAGADDISVSGREVLIQLQPHDASLQHERLPQSTLGSANAQHEAIDPVSSDVEATVRGYIQRFSLNPDQTSVLLHIASWLIPYFDHKEAQTSERARDTSSTRPRDGEASSPLRQAPSLREGLSMGIPPCQPPVCLVHGPFGSGKSTLLVAIIMMVSELVRAAYDLFDAEGR